MLYRQLIEMQNCASDTKEFYILMKLERCIIYKLFVKFSNSEPQPAWKLYLYKKSVSLVLKLAIYFYVMFILVLQ